VGVCRKVLGFYVGGFILEANNWHSAIETGITR
jgi:hypothetical protein